MIRGRSSLVLSVLLPCVACGDDTTATTESVSTTDTSPGTTDDASTGAPTTEAPTTGEPTTSAVSDSETGTTTTTGETTTTTTGETTTTTTGETTTTTGETTTTTTGETAADTSTSSTTGGECEDGPDGDGDGVPDACDVCLEGDDTVDGDGDGLADACDPCPSDASNDSDMDGVCDGEDLCLEGPDDVDVDMDGTPDACDDEVDLGIDTPIDDYDVAADGALVIVRGDAGALKVTCWNGDGTVRRPEFTAGTYNAGQALGAKPEIHIAREAQKVLVTWFDDGGNPVNNRIAYSLLSNECQPIVTGETAIALPEAYFEFHNAAIDAAGNSVITVSPNQTLITFVDADGLAGAQQEAFDIDATYGDHVAVNQATGEGIVAAQIHSGNGIYYRRFKAAGAGWIDPGPVQLPVNYHYWYDGYTVGMNDQSEFVFLWRSDGTTLDMRFFAADGMAVEDVQRTTIDFEGWNGGHCYDSFRRRHQEIPLRGDDFVLGEVYNWITPQQNRVVHHFAYSPAGELLGEGETDVNLDEGLTIRVDGLGRSFLRGPSGIVVRADYP
ncbi:hypothetical protein [Nannocystis punicea]|uniref:Thrombospondin type 3 repeat-containing protein n=1 Tax=Nannocystis punicea TaxID=2995304 RepID=A0ABY7HCP5_9BACT|nr:hypothetical protein [Nannocystis poenicansa]WAS96759.1 hypothetical protein O0S08_11470 [Nannocystis poenicansa]